MERLLDNWRKPLRSRHEKTATQSQRQVQGPSGAGRIAGGERTLPELAEQLDVHANQITDWKSQLLKSAEEVFLTEAEGRELKSRAEYEGPAGQDRPTDD